MRVTLSNVFCTTKEVPELDNSELPSRMQVSDEEAQRSHALDLPSILEEQRKFSLSREGVYTFLSRALMFEVDIEFLTMVVAVQPAIDHLAASQEGTALKMASEELAAISSKVATMEGKEKRKLVADLAVEYTALFLSGARPKGRELVWPWESAYFSDPPTKFGQQFHEVYEAYQSVGFERPKEFHEPEDHVALELAFMAHLCQLTLASIDNGKVDFALGYVKLQKEFLTDHLLRWAGKFSKRLVSQSERRETDFYHAIAMMLESYVELDDQILDHIAARLNESRTAVGSEAGVNPTDSGKGSY
jgi:TorA maturation chaperone TorD